MHNGGATADARDSRSGTRVSTSRLGGGRKRAAAIVATLGVRRRGPGARGPREQDRLTGSAIDLEEETPACMR